MTAATRIPEHAIEPLFYERWSPRAFTAEAVPEKVLLGLIEAARWAPSSMNLQPWRFVYARRGTPAFERFLSTLAPGNQLWAARAAAFWPWSRTSSPSRLRAEAMRPPGRGATPLTPALPGLTSPSRRTSGAGGPTPWGDSIPSRRAMYCACRRAGASKCS